VRTKRFYIKWSVICGVCLVTMGLLTSLVMKNVSADEPISIGVNVANKIDVALGIGPTNVDYSTFEADLRSLLYAKDPAVLPEDLFITAAKAVSANSTSEFTWWVYDHTRNNTARYNSTANRMVSAIINDGTHTYVENDLSSSQTSNSPGRPQDTNASLTTYTPPAENYGDSSDSLFSLMKNPDVDVITGTVHPYQGNYRHMIESNSGAAMDFYGYGGRSYKDFRYLPNDQKTIKTFEFAISEDIAYDALDGVGFFFNTSITDSGYNSNTQKMSGYLLFLQYYFSGSATYGGDFVSSSDTKLGRGYKMTLYKFENVDPKKFHHPAYTNVSATGAGSLSSTVAANGGGTATNVGGSGFTKIAENTTIYNDGTATNNPDFSRRIKIEAAPDKVKVWYTGSKTKNDASVLNVPIAESATPIDWTIQAAGALPADGTVPAQTSGSSTQSVRLDTSIIDGYGFGPMSSYVGHACARPTHIALQNLTMTMDVVRELVEVVREPEWHDNTTKYLVNLNEDPIDDFSSTSITGELLNRLRNDDIYYIGWATDANAQASEDFLALHNLKGLIVNMDEPSTDTYQKQLQAIADKIYERYWNSNNDNVVLTTDQTVLSVTGAEQTESADLEWPNGKWKVIHRIDGDEGPVDNDEGIHPLSGQYLSDLDIVFNLPGYYDVYYRDQYLKTIIAHREPVASFRVNINGGNPIFTNTSYDPDDETTGIVDVKWSYLDLDVDVAPHNGQPSSLIEGHTYLVIIEVTDKYGAVDSISQQVRYLEDPAPEDISAPFSEFSISPSSILKNVTSPHIILTNTSYDLLGLPISSTFTLTKDGLPYSYVFAEGDNDVSLLPVGNYSITLIVNNGTLDSVPFSRSFSIIEDIIKPTAVANIPNGSFSVNTPVTLTFSDLGGSEFKEQRVAITTSSSLPGPLDSAWTMISSSNSRIATINVVGTTYIHWEAWDHAGNYDYGTFGPYTLSKQATTVTLTTNPVSSVVYPGTIELTATFDSMTTPTGTVFFQIDGNTVGSATITAGEATFTYTPNGTYIGNVTISAVYNGDSTYNPASDSLPYTITKNPGASVTVGSQTDKTYDGTPFAPTGISVTGTTRYKVEYKGRDGTTYDSTTAPTDAGKYTVVVTTTDGGYVERTDSADFEIFKADQATLSVTGLSSSYEIDPGSTIALGTTGGSTGGTVTYVSSDPTVASVTGNILTIHTIGDFTVTATMAGNNNYNPVSSSAFSVETEDTIPPTGKITMGTTDWTNFNGTVSFDLFYKTATTLTITADDNSGEVVKIEYYLSNTVLSSFAAATITSWTESDTVTINPNTKAIVYARLTDASGNVSIINSAGIVVYSDSAPDTNTITHTKFSGHETATVDIKGNTVNKVMNGLDTLVLGVDYTVSGNVLTLLGSYLDSLDIDDYTLTIFYRPLGEIFVAATGNIAPLSTEVSLSIEKASPGINLLAPPTETGDDLVLSAILTKVGSGPIPTGTVTFMIDGIATLESTDVPLVNGIAILTISGGMGEGNHIFELAYSGDSYYLTRDTSLSGFAMSAKGSLSAPNTGVFNEMNHSSNTTLILLSGSLSLGIFGLIWKRRQAHQRG